MSIYKLKLGFLGLFNCLWTFKGLWAGPHQIIMFWALQMEFKTPKYWTA